jgi:hypothetical protein
VEGTFGFMVVINKMNRRASMANEKVLATFAERCIVFCDESEAKGYAESEKEPDEWAPLPAWPFRVMKSVDR